MVFKKIDDILKEVGLDEADRRVAQAEQRLGDAERQILDLKGHLADKDQQIERLRYFESQVRTDRPQWLKQAFENNKALWTQTLDRSIVADSIYIDDPIYKQVVIEKDIAPIFYHPIVQRLAHIKQLSFSHLTFPAATHSRLSHSLGASKNAGHVLQRISVTG